jgi:uncharacterized SAM-binding protein YcdF (DUF218 family)
MGCGGMGRLLVVVLAGFLVLILALIGLTARLFLWPPSDHPGRVDAVVVLSGDYGDRMIEARRLMARKVSTVLVHAGTPDTPAVTQMCAGEQLPFELVCLRPQPDNTRAEARAVARLGKLRHWRKIAVVTSTYHVTRAGVVFRRCFDGTVHMVAAKGHFSMSFRLRQARHEWAGLIDAMTFARGC